MHINELKNLIVRELFIPMQEEKNGDSAELQEQINDILEAPDAELLSNILWDIWSAEGETASLVGVLVNIITTGKCQA